MATPSRVNEQIFGRALVQLLALLAGLFVVSLPVRAEVQAIEVTTNVDRLDISGLGEFYEQREQISLDTAAGKDGITQRWTTSASTPGTRPAWFAFALRNSTDKQIERWIAVDRYSIAG